MKDESWKVTAITLEQQLAENRAILEAVERAIDGKEVSDFAESFALVLRAGDLRRQCDALSQENAQLRTPAKRLDNETLTLAQIEQALTDTTLEKAMHAHDFARPESSGFDEMRHVLLDALTGAGEEK